MSILARWLDVSVPVVMRGFFVEPCPNVVGSVTASRLAPLFVIAAGVGQDVAPGGHWIWPEGGDVH